MSADAAYQLAETDRRLANVLAYGEIESVDAAARTCRVRLEEDQVSADLPWAESRAGGRRTFSAPSVGERVLVASPSGELAAGVVLRGLPGHEGGAAADRADLHRDVYDDGAEDAYDEASSTRLIKLPAGGKLILEVGSSKVTIENGVATIQADELLLGPAGTRKRVAREGDAVANGVIVGCAGKAKLS